MILTGTDANPAGAGDGAEAGAAQNGVISEVTEAAPTAAANANPPAAQNGGPFTEPPSTATSDPNAAEPIHRLWLLPYTATVFSIIFALTLRN